MGAPAVREKLGHQKIGQTSIRLDSLSLSLARAEFAEKKHHAALVVHTVFHLVAYLEAQKICAHAQNFGIKSARAQPCAAESSLGGGGRLTFLSGPHSRQPLLLAVDAFRYDVSPMHDAPNCICRVLATWRTSILNRRRLPPQQRRGRVVGNLRVLGGRVVLVCT